MYDLKGLFNSWVAVLTWPGTTAAFDKAKAYANVAHTIISVAVAGLVAGIVSLLQGHGVLRLIADPIIAIVGFYASSAVYYVLAKTLGGNGDFTVQSYLLSLVAVPFSLVFSFGGLVLARVPLRALAGPPGAGPQAGVDYFSYVRVLFVLLTLPYPILLDIYAIKSAHGLDTRKAAAVVLVSPVLVGLIVCVFIICAAVGR